MSNKCGASELHAFIMNLKRFPRQFNGSHLGDKECFWVFDIQLLSAHS